MCRHPASGYVQGINDLVTPFLMVFLQVHIIFQPFLCFFSVKDLVEEVNIIFQTFYVKDFVEVVNRILKKMFFSLKDFVEEDVTRVSFEFSDLEPSVRENIEADSFWCMTKVMMVMMTKLMMAVMIILRMLYL